MTFLQDQRRRRLGDLVLTLLVSALSGSTKRCNLGRGCLLPEVLGCVFMSVVVDAAQVLPNPCVCAVSPHAVRSCTI